MSRLMQRLTRLERAQEPEAGDGLAWCCVRHAEHDEIDDLPACCPHGRRFLVMLSDNEASRRYLAAHADDEGGYRFTLTIDRRAIELASSDDDEGETYYDA